jgi:hypothetical protein
MKSRERATPPQQPVCPLIRRPGVRKYALRVASEWGIEYSRFSPSFFAAVDEATRRTIAQLVLSNNQGKRRRTLR